MKRFSVAALCLCLVACPGDLKEVLREYGYMPVRPASALWGVGSFVYVKTRDPLTVGFICTAKQVMGPDFVPMESLTNNAELSRASKKGITMQAHVSDIVSADSELQNIKSVKMILRNVKIFELTDYQVMEAATHLDKRCARAVQRRREQGFDVTLISGSIQADVSYVVSWDRKSKLDVDAKVAAVQNLSAKLGVDASATSDKTIAATGLVWGIRSDESLAWSLDPGNLPKVDRGSSILSAETQSQLEVMLERHGAVSPSQVPLPATPHPDVPETAQERFVAPVPTAAPDPAPEDVEDDDVVAPPAPARPPLRRMPESKRHSMTF